MPSPPPPTFRPVPAARHYAGLAAGFLAFALYGSLVPLHFQPLPLDEAVEQFSAVLSLPLGVGSRTDWATNILLFIPLGFCLTAAAGVDRPRRVGLIAAAVVVPVCAALSLGIEFLQVFFPPRDPSVNDVAAESLGAMIGALVWVSGGQAITAWLRRLWATLPSRGEATLLLPGYLFLLALVHVMPLDLTISPAEIYRKYKEGRIHLLPFTGGYTSFPEGVQKTLFTVLYFAPGGFLLAHLPGPAWRGAWAWPQVLTAGLALAAGVELLQLFVVTRGCDATDVVVGGQAVLAGWGAGLAWQRQPSGNGLAIPRAVGLLVWLGVVLVFNWQPFQFTTDWELVSQRWRGLSPVPFADLYEGTEYNAFDQVVHKTLLFLPLGVLLAPTRAGVNRTWAGLGVMAASAAAAVLVEAGQLFLPDRVPSVSDVLVAAVGAWLGFVMTCRSRFGQVTEGRPCPETNPQRDSSFQRRPVS